MDIWRSYFRPAERRGAEGLDERQEDNAASNAHYKARDVYKRQGVEMARPQKEGLDYFSFDVGFFSDRKVKIIKARYGVDGLAVYLYVLCEIYKDKGYYLKTDDDFIYTISDDLSMSYEKIGQILNFLLERSLFDDTLFKSDKVLSSRGIQKRFQEAVKQLSLIHI